MSAQTGGTRPRIAQEHIVGAIPTAKADETIGHVEARLIGESKSLETINYVYVIKDDGTLTGVFSIKELFRQPKSAHVKDVMKQDVVTVYPKTKQARVAQLAIKHSIKAVPVVDKQHHLLGVVPSDAIFHILQEEHTADFLRMAGVQTLHADGMELSTIPIASLFWRRFPWLIVGLLGGMGAAFVVEYFERASVADILIVAFIPAVVYIADAVGSQTQTIFIRALALEEKLDLQRYAWREARVGFLLASALGLTAGGLVFLRWQTGAIGLVIATSFFVTILIAMTIALFLPWLFRRLKWDPAIASGPFATVIRDITTLVLYFMIAERILALVG
ncbi:magnesium transporter [Candidatus Uhrbacteria bacterium]|nr:MAG: magnesium transporter [Candidatus Uhrbacteria bacterium]